MLFVRVLIIEQMCRKVKENQKNLNCQNAKHAKKRAINFHCFIVTLLVSLKFIFPSPIFAQAAPSIDKPVALLETTDEMWQVKWNPKGKVLAIATNDGLKLYDEQLQLVAQALKGITVFGISWRPDGEQIAVTNGKRIEIWNWDNSAKTLTPNSTLTGNDKQIGVFWSPDGKRIASIEVFDCKDEIDCLSHIQLWNGTTYQFDKSLPDIYLFVFQYAVYPAAERMSWSKNGEPLLAIVGQTVRQENAEYFLSSDLSIFVVNVETATTIKQFEIGRIYGIAVDWRPKSSEVAVGGLAGADIYDADSGDMLFYPTDFIERPTLVVWSPDGHYLAIDNQIFDALNNVNLGTFGMDSSIAADWHPNGYLLVTCGGKKIRIDDIRLFPAFMQFSETMIPSVTSEANP